MTSKLKLLVATNTISVTALGATQQAVTYAVSNQTNDTIDVLLTSEQPGTDDFDVTGFADRDFEASRYTGDGPFITYRLKFDQQPLGNLGV